MEEDSKLKANTKSLEEFNKELNKIIRKSEYKKFNKEFKKIKKQLIKSAKEFQAFDYGFMLNLMEYSLQAMSLFLGNKYLLMQDTEYEGNQWKLSSTKLKECYELLKSRNSLEAIDNDTEYQNVAKALRIMSKYIFNWWD